MIIHLQTGKVAAVKWKEEKENHKEEQKKCKSNVYMLYGNQKNQTGICVTE